MELNNIKLNPAQVAYLKSALVALNEQRPSLTENKDFKALVEEIFPECKPE